MFLYYFMLFNYSFINYKDFTFKGLCCVLTDRILSYGEFLRTNPLLEGEKDQSTTTFWSVARQTLTTASLQMVVCLIQEKKNLK